MSTSPSSSSSSSFSPTESQEKLRAEAKKRREQNAIEFGWAKPPSYEPPKVSAILKNEPVIPYGPRNKPNFSKTDCIIASSMIASVQLSKQMSELGAPESSSLQSRPSESFSTIPAVRLTIFDEEPQEEGNIVVENKCAFIAEAVPTSSNVTERVLMRKDEDTPSPSKTLRRRKRKGPPGIDELYHPLALHPIKKICEYDVAEVEEAIVPEPNLLPKTILDDTKLLIKPKLELAHIRAKRGVSIFRLTSEEMFKFWDFFEAPLLKSMCIVIRCLEDELYLECVENLLDGADPSVKVTLISLPPETGGVNLDSFSAALLSLKAYRRNLTVVPPNTSFVPIERIGINYFTDYRNVFQCILNYHLKEISHVRNIEQWIELDYLKEDEKVGSPEI